MFLELCQVEHYHTFPDYHTFLDPISHTTSTSCQGIELWEQYRQYEEALLHSISDKLSEGADPVSEGEDKEFLQDLHNKQRSRVENLFQRQLTVPLNGNRKNK